MSECRDSELVIKNRNLLSYINIIIFFIVFISMTKYFEKEVFILLKVEIFGRNCKT